MENLILKKQNSCPNQISIRDNLWELSFINDSVCCYVLESNRIEILRLANMEKSSIKLPLEVPPEDKIVSLYYSKDRELLLVATETYLYAHDFRDNHNSLHKLDLKSKIVQTSWNPIESHVILVTENQELFSYSLTFSKELNEYNFIPSYSGSLNKPVPLSSFVGWGAQKTQFKGMRKHQDKIEEIPQAYERPVVSWRGNGEMFVVNFWKGNKRVLKVFDDKCNPLHGSEHHTNLLPPVSFKPMGNFISTCSFNGETTSIDLTEKNCLIRSKFEAAAIKGKIRTLKFHPDKALLAIQSDTASESHLNIYYYANETWYLKQQFNYSLEADNELLVTFNWGKDTGTPFCDLYVLTTSAIHFYNYALDIYGAANQLVAVINGSKVLFTSFNKEIVPPPAASFTTYFVRPVNVILYYPSKNIYAFQLADKTVVQVSYENLLKKNYDNNPNQLNCKSSENCMTTFEEVNVNNDIHEFHLNKNGEFIIDGKVVSNNVISVYVTGKYLLLVKIKSNDCKLYCVRLTDVVKHFAIENSYARNVEYGGKIIALKEKQYVVMLMPRGNLETVTCRPIDIDVIEEAIEENKWDLAINLVRDRKLDWNLLIDLNKFRFNEHIHDFIQAADRCSVLNTILSELKTDNCLEKLYKFWKPDKSPKYLYLKEKLDASITKLKIFENLLQQLFKINPIKFLEGIIKMQIKHFSLKAALCILLEVYHLRENYPGACKAGLKAVRQMKDLKEIATVAAGLFDIEFLQFIYNQCSEDPLEHLAQISDLRKLIGKRELFFRYKMCHRANEFHMATKYLLRDINVPTDVIIGYIQTHKTAKAAYAGLCSTHKHFEIVTKLYAAELSAEHKNNEAGMILERAGLYSGAVKCYKLARDWQKAIGLLTKMNMRDDHKQQMYRSISKYLCEHGQIDDAAMILERFVTDLKGAIELYVQHHQFSKALFLLRQNKQDSDIATVIKPSLSLYYQELMNKIGFLKELVISLTCRLKTVRDLKIQKYVTRQTIYEGYDVEGEEDCGNDSEYGSVVSSSTQSSSRGSRSSSLSSRNRRKQERKKTDLKEGGVYEDIAIIRQVHISINEIFELRSNIYEFCNIILDEEHFARAVQLKGAFSALHETVHKAIPEIWSDVFVNEQYSTEPRILGVIDNKSEMDPLYETPPFIGSATDWVLSIYDVNI